MSRMIVPLGALKSRVSLAVAALALLTVLGLVSAGVGTAATTLPNILIIVSDDQPIVTIENPDPNCQNPSSLPSYCKHLDTASCNIPSPPASCYEWMPNLVNWFKIHGTKFGQAFDTTPLCCPSRASILTGRYAHNHGVITNDLGIKVFSGPSGPDNQKTMLQYYLEHNGYTTGLFGKFLNDWVSTNQGAPPNFDNYAIYDNGPHQVFSDPTHPSPDCSSGLGGMSCVDDNGVRGPVPNTYETDYIAQKVQQFIATAPQPWFVVVTPTVPHSPFNYDASHPYGPQSKYKDISTPPFTGTSPTGYFETDTTTGGNCHVAPCPSFSGKPPYTKVGNCTRKTADPDKWPPTSQDPTPGSGLPWPPTYDPEGYKQCILGHRDQMFRMLKSMDDLVGGIRSTLNSAETTSGLREPLAFYISDNGYLWGQHWLEAKPYPYTESTRVPFFMSGPGVPSNVTGGDSGRMVANIDIAPTVMKAAGLPTTADPLNAPMDGNDLLATPHFIRNSILLERYGRMPTYSSPGVCDHSAPACDAPTATDPPLWASIRTLPSAVPAYQYVENYASSSAPYNPDTHKIYIAPGMSPTWTEYYDLVTQPNQVMNSYGSLDPTTATGLHDQLTNLLNCEGHGEVSGRPACP